MVKFIQGRGAYTCEGCVKRVSKEYDEKYNIHKFHIFFDVIDRKNWKQQHIFLLVPRSSERGR